MAVFPPFPSPPLTLRPTLVVQSISGKRKREPKKPASLWEKPPDVYGLSVSSLPVSVRQTGSSFEPFATAPDGAVRPPHRLPPPDRRPVRGIRGKDLVKTNVIVGKEFVNLLIKCGVVKDLVVFGAGDTALSVSDHYLGDWKTGFDLATPHWLARLACGVDCDLLVSEDLSLVKTYVHVGMDFFNLLIKVGAMLPRR